MTNSLLPPADTPELLTNTLHGRPAISSLELAEHFEIKHKNVLRDIRALLLKCPGQFTGLNFELISISTDLGHTTRQDPAYLLTRDGFTLLAMGYNSKRAIEWKIRYIEAFNALEAHALELAREAGYRQGLASGVTPLALEAAEKASWLKGFKEGERQMRRKDGLNRLEKAVPYLQKGLTRTEIARLLDCPPSTLRDTLRRFERLSGQAAAPTQPTPQQGVLL